MMLRSALTACLAMAFGAVPHAFSQEHFDSADAAAQAVIEGAAKHDTARLAAIFGPQGNPVLSSGNSAQDQAEQAEFSKLAQTKHQLLPDPRNPNRMVLSIGDEDWPFPVPLIKANGKWSFDASGARVEMQARRIGADELDAIEICAGYVEAQQKYASEDRDKDGMLVYAPHMADASVPRGLVEATWDGTKKSEKPYHGYYFRILDGQGPEAPGGAHTYLMKNKLMGGFGLVAWPAHYGVTGIHTFIVNQDGVVFEKDVAPAPNGTVTPITRYDPDPSWKAVE